VPVGPSRLPLSEAQERERAFSDALAAETGRAAPPASDRFDYQFERDIVSGLEPRPGMRVLELGCGTGELTFQLVDAGADVTALDISPGMIDLARSRLSRFRPDAAVRFVVAPAEETGLEAGSFDAVVGKWILHHVDLGEATREVRRVLRPGGIGVFVENSELNPLLRFARNHLTGHLRMERWSTRDEHPFKADDFELLRRSFGSVQVDAPSFSFFQLFAWHFARGRYARRLELWRRLDQAAERLARGSWRYSYCVRVIVRVDR
jgi:ubiquinone/menaquinone biosynthesis C-methylase UbiE